jgi:hypothetical protein
MQYTFSAPRLLSAPARQAKQIVLADVQQEPCHRFSAAHCKGAKAAVPGCLSDSGQERPLPHSGISG